MNRLRVFALSAVALIGLSAASAQAGWHQTYYRPVYRAPVVVCAPPPCAVVAPAPLVCLPPAYVPGFNLAYYHQPQFCDRPIARFGCR
jgi:hypothetical protein